MKSTLLVMAVLLAATLAMAQTNSTNSQAPGKSAPQTQAPAGTQAQPATGGQRMLQAKSQEEMKAYQDAMAKTDPAQVATAASEFAAKYPASELKASLFMRAMSLYGQANNNEKVIEEGRKAIAADPTNPVALVQVASALAETSRETDLDRDDRLNEAAKDAHTAIDNIDTGLLVPPNTPPERVAAYKTMILSRAYDTLGMVDLSKKDYAAAEKDLSKAADLSKNSPEPVVYLRLSVTQDQLKKYPQALENANKAVQLAPPGSMAQNLAKQQQARVQKLMSAGSAPSGAATPPASPSPAAPAATPSPQPSPTTPH